MRRRTIRCEEEIPHSDPSVNTLVYEEYRGSNIHEVFDVDYFLWYIEITWKSMEMLGLDQKKEQLLEKMARQR